MTWTLFSSMKSGKREVAISLILFWAFITGYVFFWLPPETVEKYEGLWDTLTWASLAFAAGAFGVDFVMKSRASMGPPARQVAAHKRDTPEQHEGAI